MGRERAAWTEKPHGGSGGEKKHGHFCRFSAEFIQVSRKAHQPGFAPGI